MLIIILFAAITFFIIKRILTYLLFFQQQEYDNYRFAHWVIATKSFDKRLSILLLTLLILTNPFNINNASVTASAIILFLICGYLEKDPLKFAKKKLVLTSRAKRTCYVAIVINALLNITLLLNLKLNLLLTSLIIVQLIPLCLLTANLLLWPIEAKIQQKFWEEAKQKIITNNPFIIGITGSFGKTSVKHFLGHILAYTEHTLITPGSINTSMGIARIIREQLKPHHRYFVVEMGAYGLRSIKELCKLTTPHLGIITSIGKAHYERFKDLETVAAAKFELATATIENNSNNRLNNNHKMIIPEQILSTEYAQRYLNTNSSYFEVLKPAQLSKVDHTKNGLNITLCHHEKEYQLEVPIFGTHHAHNIALAFLAAYNLGVQPSTIIIALRNMPQIRHRSEVHKHSDYIVIDDAYNANPQGFKSALELLNFLHEPSGRRILVTPGLIELGTEHTAEHLSLGKVAALYADLALIIQPQRIPSFIEGFKTKASEMQKIITFSSFAQAKEWLNQHIKAKDTILFANDLPDLYENRVRF
jgi:UDP-N-acetylmuramoyl-tripeptide--D-alanyl-D-alanine ligase